MQLDEQNKCKIGALLQTDPLLLITQLIFKKNLTPLEIAPIAKELNYDLTQMVALSICPAMLDRTEQHLADASCEKVTSVLNYIADASPLLAALLQMSCKNHNFKPDKNINLTLIQRWLNSEDIELIANLFAGNKLVAALRCNEINAKFVQKLNSKMDQLKILQLQIGETVSRSEYNKEIDTLISELIQEDANNINLLMQMHNIELRAQLLLDNFDKIVSPPLAIELLETTLQHLESYKLEPTVRDELKKNLSNIYVIREVLEVLEVETPTEEVTDMDFLTTLWIEQLLKKQHFKLCVSWCQIVKKHASFHLHKKSIFQAVLDVLLQLNDVDNPLHERENSYLLQLFDAFPQNDVLTFLHAHKNRFRCLDLLKFALDFIEKMENTVLTNYRISIIILRQLTASEREQYWHTLKYPLLIIEQLLLNARLDLLKRVLEVTRAQLQNPNKSCAYCMDKTAHSYDLYVQAVEKPLQLKVFRHLSVDSNSSDSSDSCSAKSACQYEQDHIITNECIDLLLRLYASKALDYKLNFVDTSSQTNTDYEQSVDLVSLVFEMPAKAPTKNEWFPDKNASFCMCCQSSVFDMLNRRHHCRRCGRVVCHDCSKQRICIPELYKSVPVRICLDCNSHINIEIDQNLQQSPSYYQVTNELLWKLSGDISYDQIVREEFCYEFAPSVQLALAILELHQQNDKYVQLLLYHCQQLEKLIVPQSEVDLGLIAQMLHCMATAIKMKDAHTDVENIVAHANIISALVKKNCEALLPAGPLTHANLQLLADALIKAEEWELAFEVHSKFGFPVLGVYRSRGLIYLKTGCFKKAREQFAFCMEQVTNETTNAYILDFIMNEQNLTNQSRPTSLVDVKRPPIAPPLLIEILSILKQMSKIGIQSNAMKLTDKYKSDAMLIIKSLDNLENIITGKYDAYNAAVKFNATQQFKECMHYLLSYGSHKDVLNFLLQQDEVCAVLQYYWLESLDAELFVQHIYLLLLKRGKISELIKEMRKIDKSMSIWIQSLLQTCRWLEKQNYLNCLYQLQLLLQDNVRASITCVQLYSLNCDNFQHLHANASYLLKAKEHLHNELQMYDWVSVQYTPQRGSISQDVNVLAEESPFCKQLSADTLKNRIFTIFLQLEVSKFLAKCEQEYSSEKGMNLNTLKTLNQLQQIGHTVGKLPTLFDAVEQKVQLCLLLLFCAKSFDEQFDLLFVILQKHKLCEIKVFSEAALYLNSQQRLGDVEKLIENIAKSKCPNADDVIDELIKATVEVIANDDTANSSNCNIFLNRLIDRISSIEKRISCQIFMGQLKMAYLLANKHNRLDDIRKIQQKAEEINEKSISNICIRRINSAEYS